MAVVFNLIKLILILMFTTLPSVASEKVSEDVLISLALKDFLAKKEQVEKKIIECENLEKKSVLTPDLFTKIKISPRNLEVALYFLNKQARNSCEGDVLARFYLSSIQYKNTAKYFKKEAIEILPYTEEALFSRSWRDLYIKADYLSINENTRTNLEKIPLLNKPFNLHKTLEALKLH